MGSCNFLDQADETSLTLTLIFHLVIGPKEKDGVVDTNLKVYGVANLRICDASVFPDAVSGHPVSFWDKSSTGKGNRELKSSIT